MDTKRMPLMILDFNGFMGIVYAAEAENIICKDTKEVASQKRENPVFYRFSRILMLRSRWQSWVSGRAPVSR